MLRRGKKEENKMQKLVVVGTQWGDEGKGKIVDLLSEKVDMVIRFGGGNNAGHTLVVDGRKIILHLIRRLLDDSESRQRTVCDIGCGCGALLAELSQHFEVVGVDVIDRLRPSAR